MSRSSASAPLLSWLLVPVAALLVQSALSLARQPYTGLGLQGRSVARVEPGSPGDRAGIRPGDRIQDSTRPRSGTPRNPAAGFSAGRPVTLELARNGRSVRAWLVPESLPNLERRMMAAMLAVASGFVLLGGWVWSERRDELTRVFFLLCLAFAGWLAPIPLWVSSAFEVSDHVLIDAINTYLPALFVHFFALFPESRAGLRRRALVRAAYAIATLLFVVSVAFDVWESLGHTIPESASAFLLGTAGVWFLLGIVTAFALFTVSYRRAGSADARRRLRVALAGTALGVGPLALLVAIHGIWPGVHIPGEGWTVVTVLLVPASLAWATVVHQIFDFRVALRAAAVTLLLAVAGVLAYVTGEWLAATWWPDFGAGIAVGALAFVGLAASLAGPLAPWLGMLGVRVVPAEHEHALDMHSLSPAVAEPGADPMELVLVQACEAVREFLRLDGCLALVVDHGAVRPVGMESAGAMREPGPGLRLRAAQLPHGGIRSLDEAPLETGDRDALEAAGVGWLLAVGSEPVRAVLLLGRRLAGGWLSRREMLELERFADRLSVTLENAMLRIEARSRGALDRELKEAGDLQAHLLPRHAPVFPTLDCAAAALSSEPVGGDYYDFVHGPGREFTLVVGDAAGKGVPAALLLAQVQARFRGQSRRGLSPAQLLGVLNQELVGLDRPEKFVGLLCARVDVRAACVWFANAGLTPPLVRRQNGAFFEVLAGGVLLGVSPDASYSDTCVELWAGDVILVYTDGLTEARRGEELFGVERVREVLDRTAHRRAADVVEELLKTVRSYTDRPLDDLTVLVLKQLTDPAEAAREGSQERLNPESEPAESKK